MDVWVLVVYMVVCLLLCVCVPVRANTQRRDCVCLLVCHMMSCGNL